LNTTKPGPVEGDKPEVARGCDLAPCPAVDLAPEDPPIRAADRNFVKDGLRNRSSEVICAIDGRNDHATVHNWAKASEMRRIVEPPFVVLRPVTSNNRSAGFPAFDPRIDVRWGTRNHRRLADGLAQSFFGGRDDRVAIVVEKVNRAASPKPSVCTCEPKDLLPRRYVRRTEVPKDPGYVGPRLP
jgi:hypothetical protein